MFWFVYNTMYLLYDYLNHSKERSFSSQLNAAEYVPLHFFNNIMSCYNHKSYGCISLQDHQRSFPWSFVRN